jgi:Alpha/beta hydrolase domain
VRYLKHAFVVSLFIASLLYARGVEAKVVRVEKLAESPVGTFKPGPYVRLDFRVSGDLSDDVGRIADLERALQSNDGRISYATSVTLIVQATPSAGNGTLLVDVPNRGRTLAAGLFNSPRNPMLPIGSFERGNGFLQDNGFAIAVVAWELGHGVELPTLKAEDGSPGFIEGAALAIVRDVAVFLQSHATENPLRGTVRRTIGVGYSQTGRLLKSFLAGGYNAVEGRPVFSGVYIFGAAGGLINLRTLPGPESGAGQAPSFTNPELRGVNEEPIAIADIAKLTIGDGQVAPKMMFVNTTTDYFSLRASLGRTGADGIEDKPLPGNVRAYDIAGGSHALISRKGDCKHAYAVLDWHPVLRATLLMLNKWVLSEEAPPPNVLMTLRAATGDATVLQAPKHFPRATIQVPIGDMDGNAQGGIRLPDLEAPLGTHAAQNPPLSFACALGAAYVPFAATKEEREAGGDPRHSIRERYRDIADYKGRIEAATKALLASGFLLPADAEEMVAAAANVALP